MAAEMDSQIQNFPSNTEFSIKAWGPLGQYWSAQTRLTFSQFGSVTQSCLTLWSPELQHARLPCPSPTPRACSNSCLLSWWCHPTISSSVIPFSHLQSFPASEFSNESALCIRWPKHWSFSFSISPCSEYSGLISFGMDWFHLLAVQGTLNSLQHHSSKAPFFDTQLSL